MLREKSKLGIVIPYFKAADHIKVVVEKAKLYSDHILIVDDCSPDIMPDFSKENKVKVIRLKENIGVGGATLYGFSYFENVSDIQMMIKLDADDQMDTSYIPQLLREIEHKEFDFVKGNRFRDFQALKQMPFVRRFGNLFLSFLSKIATGYWNCFDFNNGYFAITKNAYSKLDKNLISNRYFFETSLIAELYFQRAKVSEIYMPAIYGDEVSNMKVTQMPFVFIVNLSKKFFSRIWKSYFVYDFNIGTIYLIFGFLFFTGGLIFGLANWYIYSIQGILTPLGTIMISALLIILGFQLLLQLVQFDILNTPGNKKN
ncbi:MAG: glycosyltransferase family 2 protein [Psychroflexus halocasei]